MVSGFLHATKRTRECCYSSPTKGSLPNVYTSITNIDDDDASRHVNFQVSSGMQPETFQCSGQIENAIGLQRNSFNGLHGLRHRESGELMKLEWKFHFKLSKFKYFTFHQNFGKFSLSLSKIAFLSELTKDFLV